MAACPVLAAAIAHALISAHNALTRAFEFAQGLAGFDSCSAHETRVAADRKIEYINAACAVATDRDARKPHRSRRGAKARRTAEPCSSFPSCRRYVLSLIHI